MKCCQKMATNYHGGGSQSPTTISKPLERVFEDAQHTGEIHLNGRKLREYPKLAAKYDLVDTISADVSKNRMSEMPKEVCSYISMEKLNCYHNVIKSIPEAIVQLQALTYLNLSRNQLSIIPSFISQLQALEVLIASHNRLVSLPEEIGVLDKLMELDVSCNEISHLPLQIGDLKSLKSLNVRRNLLQELPVEISKLNLRNLDISSNRISKIPTVFRRIETLEDIILDFNPLTTPPAHICTKGKQHIMKYLHIISIREDKARLGMLGVGDIEMKRFRKSLPPTQSVSSEEFRNIMDSPDKWKRHTVLSSDSGYSTTDSVDKCGWSPQEGSMEPSHLIESNNLAMRAAAAVFRDGRTYTPPREPRREPPEPPQRINSRLSTEKPENHPSPPQTLTPGSSKSSFSTPPTPPTLYPSNPQTPLTPPTPQGPGPGSGAGEAPNILGTSLEDEFTRELQRQKQDYENRKKIAEQLRIQQEEEDEREQRRRAAQRIQDEQRALLDRQREEAEEAKRREEEKRLADEAHKAAEEEARKLEEARKAEEARRLEEIQHQEEARQHKTDPNSSFNYNNNNAWPPPPSPLASQHEHMRSSVANQNKTNISVSSDQHSGYRIDSGYYSPVQHGYGDHTTATSPTGDYSHGQNYRSPGQQSHSNAGHSPSYLGQSSNYKHSPGGQHGQPMTGHRSSPGRDPHSPGYQMSNSEHINSGRDPHSPGYQRSNSEHINPGRDPHSPGYQRSNSEHINPGRDPTSPSYHRSNSEHVRSNSDGQNIHGNYGRPQNSHGQNQSQYGQGQSNYGQNPQYRHGSHSESDLMYSSNSSTTLHRYQNYNIISSSENSHSSHTSVLHTAYRDHHHHAPMSPVREQQEPDSNNQHVHDRYGNQHGTSNSMPIDSFSVNRKPSISASNSFKEDRPQGNQPYRRTVSDSNQRLPASSQPNFPSHGAPVSNGPIEEQVNGTLTPTEKPPAPSLNNSFNSSSSTQSNPQNLTNGPSEERPKTPQGSKVATRTKPGERGPATTSRVSKPGTTRTPAGSAGTRSALPTSRKTSLNQDEELRKSNSSLKGSDSQKPRGDQRLRSIQKDAANNHLNRRSSGSTSSEDGKRSTPTRSLAMQSTTSSSSVSKRSGTGMSGTTRKTTTNTSASRATPTSRVAPAMSQTSRRMRENSVSSTTSASSTTSKSSVDKSKRSGTVMTSAHVKMLDDYSKEANGPNYTTRRHHEINKETAQLMEQLRKTISTRLKRSLPDNLSEALCDGVLLCHLANQIRPRSVASVHVPSPAVPKLTPPKCRKNVENFLEACRKIGVPRGLLSKPKMNKKVLSQGLLSKPKMNKKVLSQDQICDSGDILSEKGLGRVAATVSALVAIATHSKHPVPSNV